MSKVKGFKVTVEGTYYAPSAVIGKKAIKPYNITVVLPDMKCALSVIKNKLLNKVIPKTYPDYTSFRTHSIIDVVNLDGSEASIADLTVREMNRPQIAEYIANKRLSVDIDAFPELDDLRDSVRLAETDPEAFKVRQDEAKKDIELNASLEDLNPDLNKNAEEKTAAKAETVLDDTEADQL